MVSPWALKLKGMMMISKERHHSSRQIARATLCLLQREKKAKTVRTQRKKSVTTSTPYFLCIACLQLTTQVPKLLSVQNVKTPLRTLR